MNTKRFADVQMMMATLGAFPDKQDFTESTLSHQTDIYRRYKEITGLEMSKEKGTQYYAWENMFSGYFA